MNLPREVVAAFTKLGSDQRGEPERAMVHAQFAYGGGVLNPVIEHVGDLTNRMTHHLEYDDLDYGTVLDKVRKTSRWLSSSFGFAEEHAQNMRANAEYRGVDVGVARKKIAEALKAYADAHSRLVVYNEAQWLARQAAIDLGHQEFDSALACLRRLQRMLASEEEWKSHALAFSLDGSGNPKPYHKSQTAVSSIMSPDQQERYPAEHEPQRRVRVMNRDNASVRIRRGALLSCLKAEVAADDRWSGLSPKEKQAYLAANPQSKYASMSVASADSWWTDLSPAQQKRYIKGHPGSKYAKNGTGAKWGADVHKHGSPNDRAGSGPGADFVRKAAEDHGFETRYDRSHTGGNEIGAYSQTGPRVGYPELHAKLSAAGYRLKSHGPNFDDHHYTYERPSETHKYDRVHLYAPEAKPGSIYKIGHSTGTRWSERD